MPVYVYSRLRLSWGFSVRRPGTSMGGPSLPLPPPSTLVGALAAGVARLLGWQEHYLAQAPAGARRGRGRKPTGARVVYSAAYRLARRLLAAGARLSGYVSVWEHPMRYSTLPYQKPANLKDPRVWFGVVGMGAVAAPDAEVEYVIVFSDAVEAEGVTPELLRAAAAGVARLGSREGLVSVVEVRVGNAVEGRGGETCLYAPSPSVEPASARGAVEVEAWDPRSPAAYTTALGPGAAPRLALALPLAESAVPGVYEPLYGCLRLRGEARAYRGGWPRELGVVAALPEGGSGGAGVGG